MTKTSALAKGRRVAQLRKEFRLGVQAAENPRELLAITLEKELPSFLTTMATLDYTLQLPRVACRRAERLLDRAGLNPMTPVGRLTPRQRAALARAIRA